MRQYIFKQKDAKKTKMKTLFKTILLSAMLAATAQADTLLMQIRKPTGSIVEKTVTVTNDTLIAFDSSGNPILKSYATLKGNLALTKSDVGLGNVDNTSDANNPSPRPRNPRWMERWERVAASRVRRASTRPRRPRWMLESPRPIARRLTAGHWLDSTRA